MTADNGSRSGNAGGDRPTGAFHSQPGSAVDEAKDMMKETGTASKEKVHDLAERQKDAGAERMAGVAHAVRNAAHELEDQAPWAAGYIRDAADRLEGAASTLRDRSPRDLAASLDSFARAQPAAFFGGAVLAGFALSRFLKSSEPGPRRAGTEGEQHGNPTL